MDVGELRPWQVNDDQVQVLSNSNVQNKQNQVASTSSQPNDQASASN